MSREKKIPFFMRRYFTSAKFGNFMIDHKTGKDYLFDYVDFSLEITKQNGLMCLSH